jgi:hypothetical protein
MQVVSSFVHLYHVEHNSENGYYMSKMNHFNIFILSIIVWHDVVMI